MTGQKISHYRILAKIGSGGMGEVYRATDERLDREVALKLLPAGTLADESARKRFRKEAVLLAKLNHPNIETVHDFDTENGIDFLVMELVPGKPLTEILAAGPLSERDVLRLGVQLAAGLSEAHARGIIHRDLKPGNLMVAPDGHLKILDFGLAQLLHPVEGTETTASITESPSLAGTLPYMAPEQLRGEPADERSDIYSTGAVLYEMATERRPFPEAYAPGLIDAILHRAVASPRQLNARISQRLDEIVLKALDKDPDRRYQSAAELRVDLEKLLAPSEAVRLAAPLEQSEAPTLEVAHVLFMDIVGYSKLPMEAQQNALRQLQKVVRGTTDFSRAQGNDELIRLPTGDGMALVFFGDPEAPVRCALEVSRALRVHPNIPLRMGVHTGPVYRLADINANRNVAGGGINLAQRVMDCGDAGHILISKSVADILSQFSNWRGSLHDLGEAEVKHGARVHIYNLFTADAGNPEPPAKWTAGSSRQLSGGALPRDKKNFRKLLVTGTTVLAGLLVAGGLYWRAHSNKPLTERDTIVLGDFSNTTGDPVFDDTLKTALAISLRQSPFLNVLSDNKVAAALKLMARPPDTKLSPDVARELCQRMNSKAYIAGAIAALGSQYVLTLKAANCQSGDLIAEEQATAAAKEKVIDQLGQAASKLRGELGESIASIQKFDVPLVQATTSSLDALRAYSLGEKAFRSQGADAALTYHKRAIEIDPTFAMAYLEVGNDYSSSVEVGRANEYYRKAFEIKEHASEWEKLVISGNYYENVTGELEKAALEFREETQSYPRNSGAYVDLGNIFGMLGEYEQALEQERKALQLDPDALSPYENVANFLLALQRLDEASSTAREATNRNLNYFSMHVVLYTVAFLKGDSASIAQEQQWFTGKPEETFGLSLASDTEAYEGHLGKARELTKRSVDSAIHADSTESGAIWLANSALREAAFGNLSDARQAAEESLNLAPASPGASVESALAYAMAGDAARTESLAQALNKRFPLDTQMQSLWLPAIRAQAALNENNPTLALITLPAPSALELGQIVFVANLSCLYPTYIRGEAYLAAGQAVQAAGEFQRILDHSGIVWNCWTGALAHLGIARANALQARTSQGADANAARARALAAYKEFLVLWKDADPDIPILKQAKREYAKLQESPT